MSMSANGAIRRIIEAPQPVFVMCIGVPGCGKSTFIGKLIEAAPIDFTVASSDNLIEERAKALGLTYSQAFDQFIKICSKEFKVVVENALRAKQNLIIDRTQVGKKSRREHLEKVPHGYKKFAITFDVPEKVLLERLAKRGAETGKHIPEFVMRSMNSRYEAPTKAEGFDFILAVE